MNLMRQRVGEKGIVLDVEYVGAVPDIIHTDPTRLQQVLINLVGNAIKFTSDGGVRMIIKMAAFPDAEKTSHSV